MEYAARARRLPAPRPIVWRSLTEPHQPGTRPWLALLEDEVEPRVLAAEEPESVVWSSLWPSRARDEIHLQLTQLESGDTLLKFSVLTPDEAPDDSKTGHIRHRVNHLFFADLRFSYGQ